MKLNFLISDAITDNRERLSQASLDVKIKSNEQVQFYFEKNCILDLSHFVLFHENNSSLYHNLYLNLIPHCFSHMNFSFEYMRGTYFLLTPFCGSINTSHFLAQVFSSLLLAKKYSFQSSQITFVVGKLPHIYKQLIKLLGNFHLMEVEFTPNKALIFENAIFTESILEYLPKREIAQAYHDFVKTLKLPSSSYKDIYISRKDTEKRKMINEDVFISSLKKRNFAILELSKMSLLEQIAAFLNAKTIVGPHGAGGANLVFADDEVKFIETFGDIYINLWHARIAYTKNCFYGATINKCFTGGTYEYNHGKNKLPNVNGVSAYEVDLPLFDELLESSLLKFNDCPQTEYTLKKYDVDAMFNEENLSSSLLPSSFNSIDNREDFNRVGREYTLEKLSALRLSMFYFYMSSYYVTQKDDVNAMRYARLAYIEDDTALYSMHLITLLFKMNNYREIDIILEEVRTKKIHLIAVYHHVSTLYDNSGDLLKAIEYAKKITEMIPNHFICLSFLANLLRKKGDFDAVIELMTEAEKLMPYWDEPQAQFAMIHEAKGELDKALECAQKAIEIAPNNRMHKIIIANILRKKGDFDAVIELMTEAEKLMPYWSEPQAQFAMIHEAKGELDKALECAQKALEIAPNNTLRQSYLQELTKKYQKA